MPDKAQLQAFIAQALAEDIGSGDHTSLACIPSEKRDRAKLLVKDEGIIAGVELAKIIFEQVDASAKLEIFIPDGSEVQFGNIAFEVECSTQAILRAERLVLNCMQRMSGIATLTNQFVFEVDDLPVKIIDTRKTTPNFRFIEKWAVRIGGGENYRDGLYDRIMIKDNHVDASGGIRQALERVQNYKKANKLDLKTTVEVRNLIELVEVLEVGNVDRIMLDNFELPLMREAVAIINGRCEVEASGGITLQRVRRVAKTGVNFISVGALTHSHQSMDLSLKIIR